VTLTIKAAPVGQINYWRSQITRLSRISSDIEKRTVGDEFSWRCNLMMGIAVSTMVYTGQGNYARLVGRIEDALAARLRGLRISTRFLRRRIHAWLGLTAAVFFTVWIGLDSIVFAVLAGGIMALGPWYLVRKLAIARKAKIKWPTR